MTENAPVTVNGTVDGEKALKEIRKIYGATANISALTEFNDVYEISVEDFMKYAKKVELKNEEIDHPEFVSEPKYA